MIRARRQTDDRDEARVRITWCRFARVRSFLTGRGVKTGTLCEKKFRL